MIMKETIDIETNWKKKVLPSGSLIMTLRIGRANITSYHYDGTRPKGNQEPWRVNILVPGITAKKSHFTNEKTAQRFCIYVAETYIKMLKDLTTDGK